MIVTKLQHGLGNQLFQYAAGLSLAHKNNTIFKLDLTWFEFNAYRRYSLHNFNVRELIATRDEIDIFFQNKSILRVKKYARKYYNSLFGISHFPYPVRMTHFIEKVPGYDPAFFATVGDVYLEGFWFSHKYILPEVEQVLRLEFTPRLLRSSIAELLERKILSSNNSVAVHIRRGDYASNENYRKRIGCLGMDYYDRALKILDEKLSEFSIFLFSDDPDWVKEHFNFIEQATIISDGSLLDFEELYLMSKCSHQIIANSTFSWWAGWLNENPTKIVIAPIKWGSDPKLKRDDRIPSAWISI